MLVGLTLFSQLSNPSILLLSQVSFLSHWQNDDEDMIYMYNAYLHKMITCLLSHPLAKDKVCLVSFVQYSNFF